MYLGGETAVAESYVVSSVAAGLVGLVAGLALVRAVLSGG